MKRISLIFVILLFLPSLLAAGDRKVRLRILDGGDPQSGVEVRITQPSPERTTGTTQLLTTDAKGYVAFTAAENVFWVTVPALNPEVTGRRFDIPKSAGRELRWDVRPREWKEEVPR